MNDYLNKRLANMTDDELIKELSFGSESFQEGVFELYESEASRRGITGNIMHEKVIQIKNDIIKTKGDKLFNLGLVLLFLIGLLWIPTFMIGIHLNKKDKEKNYVYDERIRRKSKILLIIPAILWFIMLILIMFSVLLSLIS